MKAAELAGLQMSCGSQALTSSWTVCCGLAFLRP